MTSLTHDAIIPADDGGAAPLSFGQERLWFLDQLEAAGEAAYHVFVVERLRGPLAVDALERALAEIVERHEVLRTRYPSLDGLPVQVIDPHGRVELEFLDVAGSEEAQRLVAERFERPFDLAAGPPLRATLLRLSERDHVLCVVFHHIATDGWSLGVFFRELVSLYGTFLEGRAPQLPELPIQYGDFARWQRSRLDEGMADQLGYWRDRLAHAPTLELPTDRPRPRVRTARGGHLTLPIPPETSAGIDRLARRERCTRFITLMAAYQALLARYSGQEDLCVGAPVAGRDRPELEPLIGFFLNTLVLRGDLSGDPTFRELLARTRATALAAYANAGLPFDRLVSELNVPRDLARTPLFQTQLLLNDYDADWPAPAGLTTESFHPAGRSAKFELSFEIGGGPEGLVLSVVHNADLFDAATARRMGESFLRILEHVADRPDTRLSELPLLGEGERRLALTRWDGEQPVPPRHRTLGALVEASAARTPGATALTFEGERLTYEGLNRRANRLARHLRQLGVGPESRVGVCLEQSLDLAVALLAVLKAGGAYVPLDPGQPRARLAGLLADAGAEVLVTTTAAVPGDLDVRTCVRLDAQAAALAALADGDLEPLAGPGNLAYVIYTSGSTGKPKGVAVQHRQLLNYLADVQDRFEVVDGSSFGLLQSLSFDFGVTAFYLSLMTGGCLHLLPSRLSGAELAARLRREPVDYLKMTPSHLGALLADASPGELLPRRLLILGGEASSWEWAAELARPGGCRVVNHYGPTEATVGVTTYEVAGPAGGPVTPIGRPLGHARAHVLDRHLEPVPAGVVGELYLGGDRLARGYLGRPGQTAQAFLPDPYGEPGARLYRTGDLARVRPDGELEFLGRRDLQVKIRGYRVELAEIDEALRACAGVAQAVVDARGEPGALHLVAYLVSEGERPSAGELRRELLTRLPEHMVPTRQVWLAELPLKSHGKVDRAALPDPQDASPLDTRFEPPAGPVEKAVAEVWAELLGLARVGAEDDFFDLGGHSLLAIQVVARLRRALPGAARPITVMDLFQHPTVRALAELAGQAESGPRRLLYELTGARAPALSLICTPYGGGSPIIYRPLAADLPADTALYSIAVPGHDPGLVEEPWALERIAETLVEEILQHVEGPTALYGHCGLGAMLSVELARRLEAAGRPVEAVYLGGIFPFARLGGGRASISRRLESLRSDRIWANALRTAGLDVEEMEEEELKLIIGNRRRGTREAEDFFTALFARQAPPLSAPIISVVGERDFSTEFYQERFREWHHLSGTTALVVLDEAGHFFLKHRAAELADIVTGTHRAIASGDTRDMERGPDSTWWLQDTSRAAPGDQRAAPAGPQPGMRRFGAVAVGQLVSIVGSTLTEFAIPIWLYTQSGSLAQFALLQILAIIPGLLTAPLAGAIVDRSSRRAVMLAGSCAAAATQLGTGLLLWTGSLEQWHLYPLLACLSVGLTFQRLAYTSAIPQLVPKRYLGHANGIVQMSTGVGQLIAPLAAVGVMATTGLGGIIAFDLISYALAITALATVAFPATRALHRRETIGAEIVGGWRLTMGQPGLRASVVFFFFLNIVLSPIFLLISPLVLSFAPLGGAGTVAVAGGAGAVLGGLAMSVWGGPTRRRMRAMLLTTLAMAACAAVIGTHPSLGVAAVGFFGASLGLALVNGIYTTIIQIKVPQRFHGRVFALNQMIAWSSIPLGIGVIAPLGERLFEPMLAPGGALADSVGAVIGVGPGRGIALLSIVCALLMVVVAAAAMRTRVLSRFDEEVPDALPDDVIGLQNLTRKKEQR